MVVEVQYKRSIHYLNCVVNVHYPFYRPARNIFRDPFKHIFLNQTMLQTITALQAS